MRLTDLSIRQLPTPRRGQKPYFDHTLKGFGCRVSQGGTRSFFLQHGADRRLITLGKYPIISLAEARAEAKRLLAEFTLGRIRPQSLTVPQAIGLFLEDKAKSKRHRTVSDYKRILNKHYGYKGQLKDLSYAQLSHRLSRLKDTPSEYNHALTVGKIFFNWCLKRRYLTENSLFGLSSNRLTPRSRLLSEDEIR